MKTQRPSIENRRPVLLAAGLLFAVAFTLVSFEWRTPYEAPKAIVGDSFTDDSPWEIPPILFDPVQPKKERPAPPKMISTQFVVVDTPPSPDNTSADPVFQEEVDLASSVGKGPDEKEVDDVPYIPPFVKHPEVLPSFCGGEKAMLHKIHENVKYPKVPLENGVSGVVHVMFVVRADGSLSDVKVAKSIDPWLDAEAIRVVKLLDCFVPGSQAGRPVHVPFVLPIRFKIG